MVAVEDCEEGGLRSRGALDAAEAEVIAGADEVSKVPEEFLDPKCGSFADGGQLSRLAVGVAEGGGVSVLQGELG